MRERARTSVALVGKPLRSVSHFDDLVPCIAAEDEQERCELRIVGPKKIFAARIESARNGAVIELQTIAVGHHAQCRTGGGRIRSGVFGGVCDVGRIGRDRGRRERLAETLRAQHAHRIEHDRARMERRLDEIGKRNHAEAAREIHLHARGIAGDAAGMPDKAIAVVVENR